MDLHVAGALELLIDDVVHAAAGLHQGRGDNGQAPAALDVPGRAEEPLGLMEGPRVHAAGEGSARGGDDQVVGPGEAGQAVQQDDHVLPLLHQAHGPLLNHFGDAGVVLGELIEGGVDHLALDAPLHLRDLLGPLVDEQDHKVAVRIVGADAGGDLL